MSLALHHILTSSVGMQREGVSGSEVGVQRVYKERVSTEDLLGLMKDTGSRFNFYNKRATQCQDLDLMIMNT